MNALESCGIENAIFAPRTETLDRDSSPCRTDQVRVTVQGGSQIVQVRQRCRIGQRIAAHDRVPEVSSGLVPQAFHCAARPSVARFVKSGAEVVPHPHVTAQPDIGASLFDEAGKSHPVWHVVLEQVGLNLVRASARDSSSRRDRISVAVPLKFGAGSPRAGSSFASGCRSRIVIAGWVAPPSRRGLCSLPWWRLAGGLGEHLQRLVLS
jgi:hypothetical protein